MYAVTAHPPRENVGTPQLRACWVPEYASRHFACPTCGARMVCEDDYGSGSNHYWVLRCHGRFTASTYNYGDYVGLTPRAWPE